MLSFSRANFSGNHTGPCWPHALSASHCLSRRRMRALSDLWPIDSALLIQGESFWLLDEKRQRHTAGRLSDRATDHRPLVAASNVWGIDCARGIDAAFRGRALGTFFLQLPTVARTLCSPRERTL